MMRLRLKLLILIPCTVISLSISAQEKSSVYKTQAGIWTFTAFPGSIIRTTFLPSGYKYKEQASNAVIAKSIGLPISIPIRLIPASSNSFTLFYTHNCSTSYVLSPAASLLIAAGTNST